MKSAARSGVVQAQVTFEEAEGDQRAGWTFALVKRSSKKGLYLWKKGRLSVKRRDAGLRSLRRALQRQTKLAFPQAGWTDWGVVGAERYEWWGSEDD